MYFFIRKSLHKVILYISEDFVVNVLDTKENSLTSQPACIQLAIYYFQVSTLVKKSPPLAGLTPGPQSILV